MQPFFGGTAGVGSENGGSKMKSSVVLGVMHLLTPVAVRNAAEGSHKDGGGLFLNIKGASASWVLRYTAPDGRRREVGLGKLSRDSQAAAGKSLREAREAAEDARRLLRSGIDPIEHRKAQREAAQAARETTKAEQARERATLARVARVYHERFIESSRTPKHAAQWLSSLENHVPAEIWHRPIADITAPELLDALLDIYGKVPETARRVRQRLDAVFSDAEFRGQCTGNPARAIQRKIREALAGKTTVRRSHFAALAPALAPEFMERIRTREGISARALEFAVLCAARTGEVIGAKWSEFDLGAGVWTIPGERMKAGEPHTVHLSPRALEIVKSMSALGQDWVFPAPTLDGRPLSNMAMLSLLRRMDADKETTVHGLARATFSTWAYENAVARPDVIEACLAHREADRVKAAYNRADFAAERAALLRKWADFLDRQELASNVVAIRSVSA